MSWLAKYPGRCTVCRRPIEEGADEVDWTRDGIHLHHTRCPEPEPETPCPRCYLLHPAGACAYDD